MDAQELTERKRELVRLLKKATAELEDLNQRLAERRRVADALIACPFTSPEAIASIEADFAEFRDLKARTDAEMQKIADAYFELDIDAIR